MNDTRKLEVDKNTETADEKSPLLSDSIGDEASQSSSSPTAPVQNAAPNTRRRLGRILLWMGLLWAAFKLYSVLIAVEKKPEVTYATWCVFFFPFFGCLFKPRPLLQLFRYSNEFKFRPAASPVITETLKDGRIRLRGAYPEPTSVVPQSQSHGKKKKNSKRKKRG